MYWTVLNHTHKKNVQVLANYNWDVPVSGSWSIHFNEKDNIQSMMNATEYNCILQMWS